MHSPASQILGTNYAPTYEQAQQIRDILLEKEVELARLENDISRVHPAFHRLRTERDEMRQYVEAHRALLAPVRRMPLEMMQEIFVHCLPNDKYIRPDALKAPLLLAQVCVHWRRAALSTPKLWNSLAIQLSRRNQERRLALLKSWLDRSSQHPISLFVYVPSIGDEALASFLQIFSSYPNRFKQLRLTLPHRSHGSVLNVLNEGTPLLEGLEVRFSPLDSSDILPVAEKLSITPESAPRLRNFSWSSQGLNQITFNFNLTHLTEIDVDYSLSVPECLEILRQSPELRRAEFRAIQEWSTATSPADILSSHPITLPDLHSLTLHTIQPLGTLFDNLTLPALQTLKVTDMGHDTSLRVWQQSSFTAFVARSECSIQSLHLLNVLSSEDELIQCLQWTASSLTELRLTDLRGVTVVMDRVLELLTPREVGDGQIACLAPKLEVMKLGTCLSSSDGLLAGMVESRWKAASAVYDPEVPSRIRVARFKSINPRLDADHPEDRRRLTALREAGLELL